MATIRKRGKNWQIDYFDPDGRRVRKSFKKKKDAEAELGKRVSLIAEGRYLDVKKEYKIKLSDLTKKYAENFKHQASFKTGKCHYLENFKEYFGKDTMLSSIRYVDLETYRNHLTQKLTKGKMIRTPASVNPEMSCLHHLFTKGVEWEMIEQNPFDKGKSLILKENNQHLRFLNEQEIDSLLNNCPDYLHDIVRCAINTGMRRGEILKLKWNQIRDGFIYLRETKTSEPRQIPTNDDLELLFARIRKANQLVSKYLFLYDGQNFIEKSGKSCVARKNGEKVPVKGIKRAFNAAVKRAGIEDFRFHDLRHTFASQMLLRGGTLKDIQELLGHKTMTMTLRYAHLTQESKRKAVNLLNGLTASTKAVCHKTVTFPRQEKHASL